MSPNNALHSDGPRVARSAGERWRWADRSGHHADEDLCAYSL